jgi:hypothetical protein
MKTKIGSILDESLPEFPVEVPLTLPKLPKLKKLN